MASPRTIYEAFLNPEALAAWRPPEGMKGEILAFDPREGGTFRIAELVEAAAPKPGPRGPYKKRNSD